MTESPRRPEAPDRSALVLAFDAYPKSTRARKAALAYRATGPVSFLGMSSPGRTRRWSPSGSSRQDGIAVHLVPMREPRTEPTGSNVVLNIVTIYLPALARMIQRVLATPADVVHVVSIPLVPLGVLHKLRHRSRMVLDVTERPGAVAAPGSVSTVLARAERLLLRLGRRSTDVATAVVQPDVDLLAAMGFRTSLLVRNAPRSSWRAPYVRPPVGPVRYAAIGSIFEGRGYEMLIDAVARADESSFTVHIYGPGREEYITGLKDRAEQQGVGDRVIFEGWIDGDEVSAAYLATHAGLVLYESEDPGNDGLSNKILECVASGRPVIAGDLPENRRFVTEHNVGWLSRMNVEDLAHTFTAAARDPRQLETLAERCRRIGDDWLTWEGEFSKVTEAVGHANNGRRGA